jgi:Kdo2-lipid IVA lauroyltransferase/acyltransferase
MAKHSKLQTNAEYFAARLILTTLGTLPASASIRLGQAIGRIAYVLARDLRKTGEVNLRLAFPEKNDDQRKRLLRGCFDTLGRVLGLFSHFSTDSAESLRSLMEPDGVEHLERAKAQGNGVVLFTAHLGAWELTSFGLSVLGHPFSFLVRRIDNPRVEQLVDQIRVRFGNQTLDKLAAARSMLKILRSGGDLGLLLDLNTLDEEAIFVDFFGVPAATNFLIAKLVLRTQSPIVPVFCPWDHQKQKFLLRVEEPIYSERSGDEEEDVRKLTAKLSKFIEDQIRQYPEQWLWIHKRWKTRPPGEPDIY